MGRLILIIRVALRALARNKPSALPTAVGIVIGVAAVIIMVALGQGAQAQVEANIRAMGTNILWLFPGMANTNGVRGSNGTIMNLKAADCDAIMRECPSVRYVSPCVRQSFQVQARGENWYTTIQGVGPDYFLLRNWPVVVGYPFSDVHVKGGARVCELGDTVARSLFPNQNPVGQFVRIRGVAFQVIGVMLAKGQSSWGSDQDDIIFAPYTAVMKHLSRSDRINYMMLSAISEPAVDTAMKEVTALMHQRHRLRPDQDNDFRIFTQLEDEEASAKSSHTMTMLLGGVASISLLVGGIGIMNIMLVSVSERIREIGTRMAVGARQRDILTQFFIEALVISLFGGVLGIAIGVGGSLLADHYLSPSIVSPASIVLAFGCSGGVGVFFGFYPAFKASQLDPIQALRHE